MKLFYLYTNTTTKIILLLFFCLFACSIKNPFSNYNLQRHFIDFSYDIYDNDIAWEYQTSIDQNNNKYSISNFRFKDDENNNFIYLIKYNDAEITSVMCSDNQIPYKKNHSSKIECINKNSVSDPNIHPLGYMTVNNNNFHVLGTIAINSEKGIDRLSHLSKSLYESLSVSLIAMTAFILFGTISALSISYFNNKTSFLFKLFLQIFQCVPILLWVLISMVLVGYAKDLDTQSKSYIYFFLFGLFSCPALANLLIEKINYLKSKDFIVALKLLGLSDFRIITGHMLIYCKPIIVFQAAYILAHAFFLDITLCWIEAMSSDTPTFGYYLYNSYISTSNNTDLFMLIMISFLLTYLFYSTAITFKTISEHNE